ncbi:MAG: nuclear transport factor 2 family protein [Caulobacter sp.]|nr:nuclear transport factor 2 family protein [Caulobacter sp.]
MTPAPIKQWHAYLDTLDAATLKDLLTEDVVFESPVVHTPQAGRAITMKYLLGAAAVLNNDSFHYENEWYSDTGAVLEFVTVIDGIKVNGVDIIHWNDAGKIDHFKVMVRPLKAINMVHGKMGEMLQSMAG